MKKVSEISIKDVRRQLERYSIQPSFQRLKILEYLMRHRVHPTADTINKKLETKAIEIVDQMLTLEGLRLIYELNRT